MSSVQLLSSVVRGWCPSSFALLKTSAVLPNGLITVEAIAKAMPCTVNCVLPPDRFYKCITCGKQQISLGMTSAGATAFPRQRCDPCTKLQGAKSNDAKTCGMLKVFFTKR